MHKDRRPADGKQMASSSTASQLALREKLKTSDCCKRRCV